MINEKSNLLLDINEKSLKLQELDENLTKKQLLYKNFIFTEEDYTSLVELLAIIQKKLVSDKDNNFSILNKRIIDAQNSLIEEIEKLFSERLILNSSLKELIHSTIIPYYHARFEIGLSREISLLPLELRLYIYINLLKIEASPLRQLYVMDRIALTLQKADEKFLGDCAIFIYSWLEHLFDNSGKSFIERLKLKEKSIASSVRIRTKIYKEVDITSDKKWQEFWYGFKLFCDLKSFHNIEAAKICFELFDSYFEGTFLLLKEAKPMILKYYQTKNPKEIRKFIENEGLLEVEFKKGYSSIDSFSFTEKVLDDEKTEKLNQSQKVYAKKKVESKRENGYLYINHSYKSQSDELIFPEKLSQNDASGCLAVVRELLSKRKIKLQEFSEIILNLTTSIMNSTEWDIKIQNLTIGILGNVYIDIWSREPARAKNAVLILQAMEGMLSNEKEFLSLGQGWPVAVFLTHNKYSTESCLVYYSRNLNLPDFIGYFQVEKSLNSINENWAEKIMNEAKGMGGRWQRIERNDCLVKSIHKRRNKYWLRMNKTRITI